MSLSKKEKAAMKHKNVLGAGAKKRKKLHGQDKMDVVMAEFHRGTLHSGSGAIVTDPMQAVAIGYSEMRKHKKKGRRKTRTVFSEVRAYPKGITSVAR